jgi:hypothetical protein
MSGRSLGLAVVGVFVGLLAIGCGGGSGGKGTAGHDGGAGHGGAGASGGATAGAGGAAAGAAGAAGAGGVAGGAAGGGGAAAGAGGADAGSDSGAAGAAVDGGGGNADARDASAGDALQPPADGMLGADTLAADADASGADAGPFAHGPANLCGSATSSAPTIQQAISGATYQDTAAGGQITPGMYWMTSETIFMPAVSNQLSDTLYFYGDGTFEEIQLRGGNTSLFGGTWRIVGTTLQMHETCPTTVDISFRITATDSTLTIFYDPNMMVIVYTRK